MNMEAKFTSWYDGLKEKGEGLFSRHCAYMGFLAGSRIAAEREQRLVEENEKLWAAINDVRDLIESSEGVAGLHLNGDLAPWEELLAGGKYEEWLYRVSNPLTDDVLTVSLTTPETQNAGEES